MEDRLFSSSKFEPVIRRVCNAMNYYGLTATMDAQGRVLIHPLLRECAHISGEVAVIGRKDHLEVWNRATFETMVRDEPLTDADLKELASLGF